MQVRLVDPSDENELAEWTAVLRASDEDLWPDLSGFTLSDIRAFAQHRSRSKRFDLLAARRARRADSRRGHDGAAAARQPAQRRGHRGGPPGPAAPRRGDGHRRGHGRARTGRRPRVLNSIVDVPVDRAADHASLFVRAEGRLRGHAGGEHPPPAPFRWTRARLEELRAEVARARDAAAYRVLTFEAPWPAEYIEDQCALFRCMSTDEPHGDEGHEEEIWDAERVRRERRACAPPAAPDS